MLQYLTGLAVFGFIYWLLDGIQKDMQVISSTGDLFNMLLYFWTGIIIIYILFGGIWVVRKYGEKEYWGMM